MIELTIQRDGVEIEVAIEYDYIPASRGSRDSCCGVRGAGAALEPDEPATAEITSVRRMDTNEEIELTENEEDRAIERAISEEEN